MYICLKLLTNQNFKMKNLLYLFIVGTMFALVSCGGGQTTTEEAPAAVEEVVACTDDCAKACCLGCKATEGDALCLADHSCCAVEGESAGDDHNHDAEDHDHDHDAEGHDHE